MRIEDLGRIRFPENAETALSKINPNGHAVTDDANFSWSGNCTSCVPAYELRRRGYDVSALPYTESKNSLAYDPFAVWKDPIIHETSGSGREAIEKAMASYGDGARVAVDVGWATSDGSGFDGHDFVAEQRGGKTYFIDPQTGDTDVGWYFDHVQQNGTRFARIDDLTPNDRIFECCANSQANALNYDAAGNKIGNCSATIPAADIDMSTARGLPSTHFWNRRASEKQFWENHGADKDFYLDQARGLPEVQSMLASGKNLEQIRTECPSLKNTLDAYYDPHNMIQVNRDASGNISFLDDGKHRVLAAKELGLNVPIRIADDQARSNAQSAGPVGKTAEQIKSERFQDSLLSFSDQTPSNAKSAADSDSRPGTPERERDLAAERRTDDGPERGSTPRKNSASAQDALQGGASEGNHNVVDPDTGTITSHSDLKITPSDHSGMPSRTSAYLPGDERGHLQASSTGGSNDPNNIVPQNHDVNRYGWRDMERGETDALKNGASIDSTKIAYVDGKPGDRPSAFMVNDKITYPDGHTETVHLSFSNQSYAEQEAEEKIVDSLGDDIYDAPNPDAVRESMAPEEYRALMEEADQVDFNIRDEYAPADYSGPPPSKEDHSGENSDETENDGEGEGPDETETENDGEGEGSDETEEDGEGEGSDETETEKDGEGEGTDETEADGEGEGSDETEADGEGEGPDETEADGEGEGSDETEEDGEGEGSDETEEDGEGEGSDETEEDGEGEGPDETETEADGEGEGPDETEADGEGEGSDKAENDGEGEGSDETEEGGEGENSDETEEDGEGEGSDKAENDGKDETSDETPKNDAAKTNNEADDKNNAPENNESNGTEEPSEDTEDNGISDSTEEEPPSRSDENGLSDDEQDREPASREDNGISDGDNGSAPSNNEENGISGEDSGASKQADAPSESQDNGMSQ